MIVIERCPGRVWAAPTVSSIAALRVPSDVEGPSVVSRIACPSGPWENRAPHQVPGSQDMNELFFELSNRRSDVVRNQKRVIRVSCNLERVGIFAPVLMTKHHPGYEQAPGFVAYEWAARCTCVCAAIMRSD